MQLIPGTQKANVDQIIGNKLFILEQERNRLGTRNKFSPGDP
jgi:hypothetical protein